MSFGNLNNMIHNIENNNVGYSEPEEIIIDFDNEKPLPRTVDIYEILRVLDNFKANESFRKIYKAGFDYDRSGNTISLIFKIDNFRKAGDFDKLFNSEFVENFIKELEELHPSMSFIKKIKNRLNYRLHLHGNIGLYQTGYFKV